MNYSSKLEKRLKENKFVITAEVGPPKGCDSEKIEIKAEKLRNCVDAFNITDNQTAVVRLSSFGGSILLLRMGLEPIMQICCRDRNRIALQSDILGACSCGIKNFLFISGDHQSFGNHPDAKGVYDVDSIQLLNISKNMRDNGIFQSGDLIKSKKPSIFIGAAEHPFADPYEYRVARLEKKIIAGADFIQTQSVYNLDRFNEYMEEVRSNNLHKKVKIIAGITPLKSLRMTERMKFHIPGVDIPDIFYNRMKKTKNPKEEGFKIASELISEIKKIRGVHGIHITALFWEEIIPSLLKNVNLL